MSSRERTLILKLDDSQLREAIKKMQTANAGGISSTGTTKPKGIEGLAKIFTQNSGILKTVAKLSLILAAITIMVKLITKITDRIVGSSPILQSMMKLLQTSITFILRPIGDFIGFFLRPFLIYFLRNVALPIYRLLTPLSKTLGTFLGGNLFSNLTLKYDPDTDPLFGTNGIFPDVGTKFTEWIESLKLPTFDDVIVKFKAFSRKLINFTTVILEKIRPFLPSMENIWKTIGIFAEKLKPIVEAIKPLVIEGLRGLRKIFDIIIPLVGPIIDKITPVITSLLDLVLNLINPLKETLKTVFSIITGFFNGIHALFDSIADTIRILFPDFKGIHDHSGSTTTNTTTNLFVGDSQSQQEYVDMFTFEGQVLKATNSGLSTLQ